jgi:hypothetical protein
LWSPPDGYEPDPEGKPIYDHFPQILRQAPVPRNSAIVHWCDGETNQLNAFNSEEFKASSAGLHLRLLKFNASRSGGEQPLDLSKSFMSGHTQVKHGTHSLRPVSASIKQDLDNGLASFGVELDDKHYTPLLAFLNHAPYMLQQSMNPIVLLPGGKKVTTLLISTRWPQNANSLMISTTTLGVCLWLATDLNVVQAFWSRSRA